VVSPVLRSRSASASPLHLRLRPLGLAALGLVLSLSSALAAKGVMIGSELQGYGRIVFSFDKEVGARSRIVNSVLIVEFDEQVSLDFDKLSQQLPNYVSITRADPDGKSIRFGLTDRFKVDIKTAGERVYLDIMSPKWQGMPPALPAEVVQDLVRRARAAEDQLRRLARETQKTANRDVTLRVGSAPQFKRAIFQMPRTASVAYDNKDGQIALLFDANFTIAEDLVRARLAGLVQDIEVDPREDALRISLKAKEGLTVRGFREDDTFTLDFSRSDGGLIEEEPKKAGAVSADPAPAAKPVAARPETPAQSAAPEKPAPRVADKAEPPRQVSVSDLAAERPIETVVEAGVDAEGFAFRLGNLGTTPIAILQRGRALFILVETAESPNTPVIPPELAPKIESLTSQRVKGGTAFRLVPAAEGRFWLTRTQRDLVIQRGQSGGNTEAFSGEAITLRRAFDGHGREAVEAPVGNAGGLHLVDDPETGARMALVPVPRAAYASPKGMVFAEFSIEPTLAGLAVLPLDEAVTFKRVPDALQIGHDIKLNLSAMPKEVAVQERRVQRPLMLDVDAWIDDSRGTAIRANERDLLRAAAEAPRVTRSEARAKLARFYLANALHTEAQAVLDVLAADDQNAGNSKQIIFLRALTAAMMGRQVEAGRLLSEPAIAMEAEQRLLQGIVDAKSMRYAQATAHFKASTPELDRYPEALQSQFRHLAIEAAIEAQDPLFARDQLLAYEKIDTRYRNPSTQQLLAGRLAESQGQFNDAYHAYSLAMQSRDRRIEAEARFGKAIAGLADGKLAQEDARAEFETLAAIWRRSEVEVKSLEKLGEFYAAEGRWREAFLAAQRATAIMPDHPATRRMEEAMGRRFENLFLNNEADKLSKVESLALYQEFRSLMPVGRRGDEIARRLADRLYDLDLVHEAAEILEHQVKNRLEGVARASVATRLAVMYLQNRQPTAALTTLRATRLATLPEDLRRPRTLLEAKALGDLFRTDLAGEILANDRGEDVDRLRADIYWKGKKWREAGESYERVLGDSWQKDEPLTATQRLDALRAGLAYVLGEEKLALDRLRGRYLARMAKTEDAAAFSLITNDKITRPQAFRDVARSVVNADTMTEFMSSYRKRYPETGGSSRPVRSAGEPKQSALGQAGSGPQDGVPNQPLPGNG
jgi:hypothetical protein